jgi:hypothetical protein
VCNPEVGKWSRKLSFTIRDSIEDTINVEIKLPSGAEASSVYKDLRVMETVVQIIDPDFKDNDEIKRSILMFCLLGIIHNKDSIENIFNKTYNCLIRKTLAIEEWNLISSSKKNHLTNNITDFKVKEHMK